MRLSRRSFLSRVGTFAAAASLTSLVPGPASALETIGANPALLNKRAGTFKYNTCLRNCADRCLLKFSVQNGRATWVEGDATQFKTGTCPCVKGLTYVQYMYAPDRILHPMVRIGPKGSGKWRRITWDEAWDILIKKTHEVVDKYGGEAILPYSYSGNYGTVGMRSPDRFFNRIGASYLDRKVCVEALFSAFNITVGGPDGPNPEEVVNADCYVGWGVNEAASCIHFLKYINIARDKGKKVLCVNPNRTPLCSQADIWLQPKPATDTWLVTGMIKYIFDNHLEDRDYLNQYCMGVQELEAFVKTVSWDDIVKVTGVPRKDIEEFADVLAHSDAALSHAGWGANRHYNGGRISRACTILWAVCGLYGKPNSGLIAGNRLGIASLNGVKGRCDNWIGNVQHVNMNSLDTALQAENPTSEGKPIKPIHMLVFFNGNPLAVAGNVQKLIKDFQREDLFVVGFDFLMTDSMDYCDLILPSCTQFETEDVTPSYYFWVIQICEKVVDPLGESMSNWDFFREYAKRMGFTDPEFDETSIDVIKAFMDTDSPVYKGVTYERVKKERFVNLQYPMPVPREGDGKILTPSGKIEIYSQKMKDLGFNPVIDLGLPNEEMEEAEAKLPFDMISPAMVQRENSQFYNVKYIRAFNAYECEINPKDAARLGIKNGQRLRLSNPRGEAFFGARITTRVPVGTVRTVKCNWMRMNPYGKGTNTNCLCTTRVADLGGGSAYHSTRVNVEKA